MKAKIICCLLVCLFLPTEICGLLTEKRTGDSFLIPIDSLSLAGASIEGQVIWPDGDEPSIQVVEQWRLIGDDDAALLFSCGFGNPDSSFSSHTSESPVSGWTWNRSGSSCWSPSDAERLPIVSPRCGSLTVIRSCYILRPVKRLDLLVQHRAHSHPRSRAWCRTVELQIQRKV